MTEDSSSTTQWGWYTPGTTDVNNNDVAQTTYTTPVVPGINYQWWVQSYVSSNSSASDSAFGYFSCNAPPPASLAAPTGLSYQCNAQNNQVTLSWNPVSVANFYLFRLNDTTEDSSSTTQWGWYTPGTTDVDNIRTLPKLPTRRQSSPDAITRGGYRAISAMVFSPAVPRSADLPAAPLHPLLLLYHPLLLPA